MKKNQNKNNDEIKVVKVKNTNKTPKTYGKLLNKKKW